MAIDNSGAPGNYGSKKSSEYRGSASGMAAAKKKAAAKKTVTTSGTKVSQSTIDKIKAMGMKKALAGAANASPEMREGLKRMYGANRVPSASSKPAARSADAARAAATKPVARSADAARASAMKPSKPAAKSADAARMAALQKSGGMNMPYKSSTSTTKKNVGSRLADAVTGRNSKPSTTSSVAATNAKRMGISVAEYNKRMAKNK